MEPLKWPVAPDGYIPNSVIRSWGMKKKVHSQTESSNDVILSDLESTTHNEEDFKTRIFWFDKEEADEEERTADVIGKRNEFVDEKKRQETKSDIKKEKEDEKDPLRKLEGIMKREEEKDRMDERREGKMVGTDLLKSSHNIQTNTGTIYYEEMKLERNNVISIIGPERSSNMQGDLMLCVDASNTQRPMNNTKSSKMGFSSSTLGHNTGEDLDTKLCDTRSPPFLSVTTKQKTSAVVTKGLDSTIYTPLTQPQDWTCHPQMSDPPVTDQPQPDFAPSGGSPVRDKVFLLSKEKNFTKQAVPPLDPKALRLFRKYKDTIKNSSHYLNTGKLHLNTHRNRSFAPKANLSSFPIQHNRTIHPEPPDRCLDSGSLGQSVLPEHLSVHQRVVQKIQRKDTVSETSTLFHHVIPMAAQNSFATLSLSGTTQYGILQFDWIRGHEEDKLLDISGTNTKDTHYVLFTNRALCHPNVFV
ncbi:uncharacterized protein LOC114867723 [Betta splendens]|uniref:Uncharacterized protein LOC114867723 n=1 Tax=Betta splendens TaxID=158456 RepID=A0A6P7PAS0_BETSP|nr:uncharacterized protein LOC114867723 [Betta splendens]